MKKILVSLFSRIYFALFAVVQAFAEITVATAEGATAGGTLFSDAIRAVYSKEIEFKALPIMRFRQFATIKNELGVEPGLTVSMLVYDNLALGGALKELTNMTTQALSGSLKQLTVTEYGKAISVSELAIQASFVDIMADASTLLSRDYALVTDCELRDAALSNPSYIVYAAKSNGTKVDSRSGLDSTCVLKVSSIKDAVEILATNNAPKYAGADYICFVHPHQSRGLRDDAAWIKSSAYGAPNQLFTGEIGKIDDTRFIETTLMCNGAVSSSEPSYDADLIKGAVGASADTAVYQAVIFGDAYYGIAVSLPVELRDNGVEDFGRKRSLAWYSIFGVGLLHKEYGVVIETA